MSLLLLCFLLLFWFLTLKIGPSSDMLDYIRALQSEKKTIIKIRHRNGKPNANYIAPFPVRWKTMSFYMHEYGWHDTHGPVSFGIRKRWNDIEWNWIWCSMPMRAHRNVKKTTVFVCFVWMQYEFDFRAGFEPVHILD